MNKIPVRRSLPRRAAACPVVASSQFRRKQPPVAVDPARSWTWLLVKHLLEAGKQRRLRGRAR